MVIKNQKEIELIEKACEFADKTFDYILKEIKVGVTEKEISLKIQRFTRKNNAKISFRPVVAFGKNTAEIHHKPNHKKLKKNNIIMLDFGTKVNNYCSDMTRTIFMGKASEKQKRIYKVVLEAQKKSLDFLNNYYNDTYHRSGNKQELDIMAKDVDRIARDYIISQGYPAIPHALGHGIGKKVHEKPKLSPKSKAVLKIGMVFSVEPGIYLKNFGGIRIEDLVVLEEKGPRLLTHSPKNIIEL